VKVVFISKHGDYFKGKGCSVSSDLMILYKSISSMQEKISEVPPELTKGRVTQVFGTRSRFTPMWTKVWIIMMETIPTPNILE
jgi:hypothetical protein